MNKLVNFKIRIILFLLISISVSFVHGQTWPVDTIQVKINSGNPKYPFPQFQEYSVGKTLAKYNPVGVVHAEMEKTIREAYDIMMNATIYTGQTLGTGANQVRYMAHNPPSAPEPGPQPLCSEGDGYALIAAAYMGDKNTFDGLWCRLHDNRLNKVRRYSDCQITRPNYPYGPYIAGWQQSATAANTDVSGFDVNGAPDGDFDIALGLLIAYYQWGEYMGIADNCGNQISYKEEAVNFIKALADTVFFDANTCMGCPGWDPRTDPSGANGYYSGHIGFDGYMKRANTVGEVTPWAYGGTGYSFGGKTMYPRNVTSDNPHTDYLAPAYFRAFATFLQNVQITDEYAFVIEQFKRVEASSDWIMGQLAPDKLPYSGQHSISAANVVTFSQYDKGEDFRNPMRTLPNYMWYGDGQYTWDPLTHTYSIANQTFELQNAQKLVDFLRKPEDYMIGCENIGTDPIQNTTWKGTYLIRKCHDMNGLQYNSPEQERGVNNARGASMSAPIITGETDLLAKLYRDVELHWDNRGVPKVATLTPGERDVNGTASYMHDFFRLLGMLVATGNWQSPLFYNEPVQSNMKVYKSVSKTYAFIGDTLKYTISYRNFASIAATGVVIEDVLPSELDFVSASNGGTYAGGKVTWSIGSVPGFQTLTGVAPTKGFVTIVCRVRTNVLTGASICNKATISSTNGTGWESNEYPNNVTATMERNCVDIVGRAFAIEKEVDRSLLNPGDIAEFSIRFENLTDAGWLNGGRPGVNVTHAYGYAGTNTFMMFFRIFHGAEEAYIDYGNYRVSYYLNNPSVEGFYPAYANGWVFDVNFMEGGDPAQVQFDFQKVPFGSQTIGGITRKWDQRLICKFPNSLGAISQHLYQKWSEFPDIHKGAFEPFRTQLQLELPTSSPIDPVINDSWSYDGISSFLSGYNDKSPYYPITPDWTDRINFPAGKVVDRVHPDVCETRQNYDRVLVEEWDGYTWRRAFGQGPLPGREQYNVVVLDTLPADLEWVGFTDSEALGVEASYDAVKRIIKWEIPAMLVGSFGDLKYEARAIGTCPMTDKEVRNWAWIYSSTESPLGDYADVKVTCAVVPPPSSNTSIYKASDKTNYAVGEDITYTLSYKQTQGTQAIGNLPSSADWDIQSGDPSFNASNISFGTDNFILQEYSHGTNGEFDIHINNTNGNDIFSIVLRYESGIPNTVGFDGVGIQIHPGAWGKNSGALIAIVDGNSKVVETPGFVTYADPIADTLKFHISLKGDKMEVWLNKNYLTDAPILSASGVRVQPGYLGFVNGKITNDAFPSYSGGVGTSNYITYWKSNFDSAFDILLEDPLPSTTTYVSSSLITLYDQWGRFSTSPSYNSGKVSIEWQLNSNAKAPVLYGDSVSLSFKTTVSNCSVPNIINTFYASLYNNPYTKTISTSNMVTCGSPLPVALVSFEGDLIDGNAVLSWSTSQEINNDHFNIERSFDGENFEVIGSVDGKGNTNTVSNYTFTDYHVIPGVVYYRLTQVDIDGTFEKSKVVTLRSGSSNIMLYPNPYTDKVIIRISDIESKKVVLRIYSLSGVLVMNSENFFTNENILLRGEFADGVYLLEVINGDEVSHVKLVKNK